VTTTPAAVGTDALTAVFTPTDPNAFGPSSASLNLTVNASTTSGTVPLATNVPATGAFSLTVDSSDTVTLTVSGSSAAAATTPVTVSDTRNTFPGWSVSGQAGNFTGTGIPPQAPAGSYTGGLTVSAVTTLP